MEKYLFATAYIFGNILDCYINWKLFELFLGKGKSSNWHKAAAFIFRSSLCAIQYAYYPHVVINMLTSLSTLFIISLFYGGNIVKKLITSIILYVILLTSEVIMGMTIVLSGGELFFDEHNDTAFSYVCTAIIIWIIYIIIKHKLGFSKNKENLPVLFDLIIVMVSASIYVMVTIIFKEKEASETVKMVSVICLLIILFMIIYLYDTITKYYTQKIRAEIMEKEKNYYFKQAEILEQTSGEIRNLRHDMKNHLYAIKSLIGEHDREADIYIENIMKKIDISSEYSTTGNLVLDSLINYKLTNAEESDVRITTDISVPNQLSDEIENIVAIMGNLLDNAIEACKETDNNRYIDMKLKYKKGIMFIDIKNSYNGRILIKKGEIVTCKEDKSLHGIGLNSVKRAAEECNGTVKIDYDDKEFRVNVMIYV